MFYYIVGLLDLDSYKSIEKIQKYISHKYGLYKELPTLHVTLEIVEDPKDLEGLCTSVAEILNKYKEIPIYIDGAICFDAPFKSVNLNIKNEGVLKSLIHKLNHSLKEEGFKVRENIDNWDMHISLANTNFSIYNWSVDEYNEACSLVSNSYIHKSSTLIKIEIWRPINDKTQMTIYSYDLN